MMNNDNIITNIINDWWTWQKLIIINNNKITTM